ncbi:MAG: FAD-dependent oxidoreductase [Phycisphaerales bacterium]|nr:FAD-dependent oxidoreductase [Phycisphaerales bacterium]
MRIAIIGTGISGLTVAHYLHRQHDLTLFEAADYVGGHTNTVEVDDPAGAVAVDTGFIVFNEAAYPNFCRLLDELGVRSKPSSMSFAVSCRRTGVEYAGNSLNSLFCQRANLLRPWFHRMIFEILRFNRTGRRRLTAGAVHGTLGAYLREGGYSRRFIDYYIVPMGAAIWSADPSTFLDTPAQFFLQFFANHGMLAEFERPTWRVIEGGSKRYVERLIAPFREKIRLNTPVRMIRRTAASAIVETREPTERFDRVVIAVHGDQALRMLADPTAAEREVLGAVRYQPNRTLLHTDRSQMPGRRLAWSSWNYRIPQSESRSVRATYYMNMLQGLRAHRDYFVTLTPDETEIDERARLRAFDYEHPTFTPQSVAAQARRGEISGHHRTHYCGAYWGYGFHEDGVRSGLEVVREFSDRTEYPRLLLPRNRRQLVQA